MFVLPDSKFLEYSGRIDWRKPDAPMLVYPCSYIRIRFTGNTLKVFLENHQAYWDSYMGYILDGMQYKFRLSDNGKQVYAIDVPDSDSHSDKKTAGVLPEESAGNPPGSRVHECLLFKRMDACHHVTFYGFELEDGGEVLPLPEPPQRRMEFYGDSVSAGEVSEAVDYTGKEDPVHNGEFSNSWYSYAWMTARRLHAQIHDIAQGGIALSDHTGWFCEPDAVGMESIYDKTAYNPQLGSSSQWDFSRYTPHVAVIAVGQNDSHPQDYMAQDPHGEKAENWKRKYKQFVLRIREKYPDAVIILATTILCHHAAWDEAIEEVCRQLKDTRIYHFLYSRNGSGTPGHIRIPEAEQMSKELAGFIQSLGERIWE